MIPKNILVTGAGGDIAQSICRILKDNDAYTNVIGTDLHLEHVGKFVFDKVFVVARCDDSSYRTDIKQLVNDHNIELIIPTSEPELKLLLDNNVFADLGKIRTLKANTCAMQVGFDKFKTIEFLKSHGLVHPKTDILDELEKYSEPLIVKSRNGSGSKDVFKVQDEAHFNFLKSRYGHFIAQEYIANEDEYTCGLFADREGVFRSIIVRRKLMPGGVTGYGEIVDNKEITSLLRKVAEHLQLRGSINVQLRLSERGPLIFEINPRFSSTVYFRHLLGFKDLIWSIEDLFEFPLRDYVKAKEGMRFYRGYQEYIQKTN